MVDLYEYVLDLVSKGICPYSVCCAQSDYGSLELCVDDNYELCDSFRRFVFSLQSLEKLVSDTKYGWNENLGESINSCLCK